MRYAGNVDHVRTEKEWKTRGFSCGLWIDPPGQEWNDFSHGVDELFMLVEGELELEISGRVLKPKSGEEVLIPAHAAHSVRNVGGSTARWLYGYKR